MERETEKVKKTFTIIPKKINQSQKKSIIIIDGSYFCFQRYFATKRWWSLARPDEVQDYSIDNQEFVDKYIKTFGDKINELKKKLNCLDAVIYAAKDCHRKDIWRKSLLESYKDNRVYDNTFQGGPFFSMAYKDNGLFKQNNIHTIFQHPKLEADDCVNLFIKHIQNKKNVDKIYIIANDMDYLQLASEQIRIYDMNYKCINDSKKSFQDSEKDLFCKIIIGDKSDNIPAVKKGVGIKTAEKIYHDNDYKTKFLNADIYKNYELNKKLIDFNEIPECYQMDFYNLYCK
tara:strand:+ start:1115 stop:1978 length:864 start_codon:yes stop_codon:yes gene_type:complete